jgi:hypothetical protein
LNLRFLALLVLSFAACGKNGAAVDGSVPGDLAVADDAGMTDDADMCAAGDDLATAPDLALAGGDDAGGGGGTPDLGRCNGYTGSGAAAVISGPSHPLIASPAVASDGTSTMAVWTVAGAGFPSAPSYGSGAWARLQNGSVVEHGTLPAAISDTQSAQLFVFAGRFHLFVARALYAFNAGNWTLVAGFTADAVAQSGGNLVGIVGSRSVAKVKATLYDGTTVGTATQISSNYFGAVADDGAGGFAVFTVEQTSPITLHMLTYDGASWSAESTIGTQAVSTITATSMAAAHSGSLWCLAYVNLSSSYNTVAWVQSGGTWSSTSFGNGSPGTALAGNNGGFALGGGNGWTAVYAAGTWTQTTLTGVNAPAAMLLPFQSGYVLAWSGPLDGYSVSVYDGASWATPTTLTSNDVYGPQLSVGASTIATAWAEQPSSSYFTVMASVYASGTWSAATQLSSSAFDHPAVVVDGSNVVAALPEVGAMKSRTYAAASWAASISLPGPALDGAVRAVSMARAANGHALAAWTQFDGDSDHLYLAEYDGTGWAAPVEIEGRASAPHVAASGNTFAVIWDASNTRWAAAWTGSGLSTPHTQIDAIGTAAGSYSIAADGNNGFVALYENGSFPAIDLWSVASSDGVTWSAPQKLETSANWKLLGIVGGPAGVVEWSTAASNSVSARQYHSGTWSAATTMNAYLGGAGCRAAVGNSDAMLACVYGGSADARLFSGGAWTSVTPTGAQADQGLALGSDGTDYRLDTYYSGSPTRSRVLHAGAWSAPVDDAGIFVDAYSSNGGYCGHWVVPQAANSGIARANGAGAYGASTSLAPGSAYNQTLLVSWPGVTDAIWKGAATTSVPPATWAALGL